MGLTFWRLAYAAVLVAARPWLRLRLKLKSRSEPAYGERIAERFGRVPDDVPVEPIWFHTVSAGETIAAAPLLAALAERFPGVPLLVTTMTPTGSAQVRRLLGDAVAHCYAPYDFPDVVEAFYDRVRPRLLVLMETELWPNMLRTARERSVPALLINARLSERSARGYRRIAPLTRAMLASLARIACQYPDHAQRFRALGASEDQLLITGSVKFDVDLPADHDERVAALRSAMCPGSRPVWIAASTHDGEEVAALRAHRAVLLERPDALLVLVPRHPSRTDAVARLVAEAGLGSRRLSECASATQEAAGAEVLLGDTMGDLLYLYGLSDVAFIGGSLVPVGGHNPIEAAVCRLPLVTGPHTRNFDDVIAAFEKADCLERVADAAQLGAAVIALLADSPARADAAARAVEVVRDNRGASERLLDLLSEWLVVASPQGAAAPYRGAPSVGR